MSYTAIEQRDGSKTGTIRGDLSSNTIKRTTQRRWIVMGCTATTQLEDIVSSGIVPAVFSAHPTIPSAILTDYDGSPIGDNNKFEVTATYQITDSGTDDNTLPWDRTPFNVKGGATAYQEYLGLAYDNKGELTVPVLNSAGDMFANVPPNVFYRPWVSFSYNLKSFNPDWVDDFSGTINKDAIAVVGANIKALQARILEIGYSYIENASNPYWQIDMKIEKSGRGDSFITRILNAGFHFLETGKKYEIYHNGKGQWGSVDFLKSLTGYIKNDPVWEPVPTSEPQLLDSNGTIAFQNGTGVFDPKKHIKTFQFNKPAIWKTLSIPKRLN